MERAFKILDAVVDEYIKSGEPVGSTTVKDLLSFAVSAATIRAEMASLEADGYLEQPHTSAGRIPTVKGYKLYIARMGDAFRTEITAEEREKIDSYFSGIEREPDEVVIEAASRALAEVTRCAIVTADQTTRFSVITKVEVVPTGKRMYVLLLITSDGSVKNRVCRLTFDLTEEHIEFFKRFVSENIEGLNAADLTDEFLNQLYGALGSYVMTLSPLLQTVAQISAEANQKRFFVEGEKNLSVFPEQERGEIIRFIESRDEFTQLMETAFGDISVMFGDADGNGHRTMAVQNTGFISGSFRKGDRTAGTFGALGPLRLDYKKVVPYIKYFTEKVSDILTAKENEED